MLHTSFVYTKDANCMGCNKCIYVCPTKANEAFFEDEMGKVLIKDGHCISCGECLLVCDHGARDYYDDLNAFFDDLRKGEKISVIAAPSLRFNVEHGDRLFGYLKSIGVNQILDVSLGADICTWAHVKAIREKLVGSIISQPCPVIVSYIEKYQPKLLKHLSPIQSPAMCVSIYLKKYLNVSDKILFLSPCIGKKRECMSENTYNTMEYNITFSKLLDYLEKNNINLEDYPSTKFDNIEGSLGFAYARPGGMSENIRYHLGEDIWIKQIEGIQNIGKYFAEYIEDVENGRNIPDIIDALNCEHGCNLGTGTRKSARQNEIDYFTNKSKKSLDMSSTISLNDHFNDKLNFEDFKREYLDLSTDYTRDSNIDMEQAFISLGKIDQDDREINCFCCGYGNCYDFVYDLATGHNDKNNCRHYLLNKFKKLSMYDDLTGLNNRNSYNTEIVQLKENHPGLLGIAYVDINGLKEANDTYGHSYGDELIIYCASILRKTFDKRVYRVGGDEFVVLEPVDKIDEFKKKFTELREMFASAENLNVSIGSSVSYSQMDIMDSLDAADQMMYNEKQEFYAKIERADRRNRHKS